MNRTQSPQSNGSAAGSGESGAGARGANPSGGGSRVEADEDYWRGGLRSAMDERPRFALAQEAIGCLTTGSESGAAAAGLTKKIPAASVRG